MLLDYSSCLLSALHYSTTSQSNSMSQCLKQTSDPWRADRDSELNLILISRSPLTWGLFHHMFTRDHCLKLELAKIRCMKLKIQFQGQAYWWNNWWRRSKWRVGREWINKLYKGINGHFLLFRQSDVNKTDIHQSVPLMRIIRELSLLNYLCVKWSF